MAQRHRRSDERRLPNLGARLPDVEQWVPDEPPVDEATMHFPISETAKYVQRYELDRYDGIVEFAVTQMRLVDGEWRDVVRYDSCHGKGFHWHLFDRLGRQFSEQQLRPIRCQEELEEALDSAVTQVVELWQEFERRSDCGR